MNCRGKILDLSGPIVMGILNVTPDSFYNKGRDSSLEKIIETATRMIGEGAMILDIGGQSSRPKSEIISVDEELKRVIPVIEHIHAKFPSTILSIDTFSSDVALHSIEAGVDMINDIRGAAIDSKIIDIAVKYNTPYVCMHMQGNPQTMQENPSYKNVSKEVYQYFSKKVKQFKDKGLNDVILDVGFGFGKTLQHNYQLLNELSTFLKLGKPLLVGISRKSMVYKPLETNAEEALNGTTALNMVALQHGAKILRVHDVKEAKEVVNLHKILHGN